MNLRLCNPRSPTSVDALTPHQTAQLAHAGRLYDGQDLPASARLGDPDEDADNDADEEACFGRFVTLWDVEEDGTLRYEAWLYQVDSGTVFRAGTLDVVAEVIQFGVECTDADLKAALKDAADDAWHDRGEHTLSIR